MNDQPQGDWMDEESDWDESTYCHGGQGRTHGEVEDAGTNVLAVFVGCVLFIAAVLFWRFK